MTDEERKMLYEMWTSYQPSPLTFPLKYTIGWALGCGIAGIVIGTLAMFVALSR